MRTELPGGVKPALPGWVAIGIFVLYSALNFLDRQTLAALAPAIRKEFGLSNADYGVVVGAFSLAYALASPVLGFAVDRLGLTPGATISLGFWSAAGLATGLT